MALLSAADGARIEAAVKAAEGKFGGEIVVAVVERSSDYGAWRALGAATFTLAATYGLHAFVPALSIDAILLALIPLGAAGWLLAGLRPLLLMLAPDAVEVAAVEARAKAAFLDLGVIETRDRTGILIFISELEHRVHILADKAVNAREGHEGWARHVAEIVSGIRAGRPADGVAAAVESIANELAPVFPRREGDSHNQLSDSVHIG